MLSVRLGFIMKIPTCAESGHVTSQSGDFSSVLPLMEERFHSRYLARKGDRAREMSGAFDLNQKRNPPLVVPVPTGLTPHHRKRTRTCQPSVLTRRHCIRLSSFLF